MDAVACDRQSSGGMTTHDSIKEREVSDVRRRQPEAVKARILKSALKEFATKGYSGATTRGIAGRARVKPSLLLYHFKSKELLWRHAMAQVMNDHIIGISDEVAKLGELSAGDVLRNIIRRMVENYSEFPELHRIMTELGQEKSRRHDWAIENFVRVTFQRLCKVIVAAQKEGVVIDVAPERLRYAIVSMASVPFSLPHEFESLVGRPFDRKEEVEATIDIINTLVFSNRKIQSA